MNDRPPANNPANNPAIGATILLTIAVVLLTTVCLPAAQGQPTSRGALATPVTSDTIAAVIDGPSLAESTLVGVSGQVYRPSKGGGWQRSQRGGIACMVRSAFRADGELWAMCDRAPLFHQTKNGVWSAEPLANRGRARSAQISPSPLFSIGRHLYRRTHGAWERVSTAPARIRSLLASGPRHAMAVSLRGDVLRLSRRRWKAIIAAPTRRARATRQSQGDPIRSLFGSSQWTYGTTESGQIVHISSRNRSRAHSLKLPNAASGFVRRSSCALSGGEVLAIGTTSAVTPDGTSTTRSMLLIFRGASATNGGELPSLDDRELFHLIHCSANGTLLIATTRGRVFVRDLTKTWHLRPLDTAPPVEMVVAEPASRPAQTR